VEQQNTFTQRKRKIGLLYTHLSLDAGVPGTDMESLHESVPADFNLEELATDHILLEELTKALRTWKPWAEEMLELYLSGTKRFCTMGLCQKYRLGGRAIRKRKNAFEKFAICAVGDAERVHTRELTDDEAIIIMVDSNLQREQVLPSEKAFAYKMNIVETIETVTTTTLYITVTHMTADEMAILYHFTADQRMQLEELLAEGNCGMWDSVLNGV